MRSCEYLKVSASEQRRTKALALHNLRFFQHGNKLPHHHPELHAADTITITFIFQKNDERNEDVTMHCTLAGCAYFSMSYSLSVHNDPVSLLKSTTFVTLTFTTQKMVSKAR